jgi:hypothetical protein
LSCCSDDEVEVAGGSDITWLLAGAKLVNTCIDPNRRDLEAPASVAAQRSPMLCGSVASAATWAPIPCQLA